MAPDPSLVLVTKTSWRSSRNYLLLTISLAVFTDIFLYGVIIPILPHSLVERANIRDGAIQYWCGALLAAYGAGLFFASILCGCLMDKVSSRRVILLLGLVFMTGATILLYFGRTIHLFVIARVFQGVAAAVVWSTGLALLHDSFGLEHFPSAVGFVVIAQSSALMIGPLIGGIIYSRFGYHAVFIVCFSLLGVDIFLRLLLAEAPKPCIQNVESREASAEEQQIPEETTPLIESKNAAERSSCWAFIPILRSPKILIDLWCLASINAIWSTFDATLPLKMKMLFSSSSLGSGMIFLPLVLPALLAPFSGKLISKFGATSIIISLLILRIPASTGLSFVTHNTPNDLILLLITLLFSGTSLNMVTPAITSHLIQSIKELDSKRPALFGARDGLGHGFGLINCAFAFGSSVGPVLSAMILEKAGWGSMCLTMSAVDIVTVVLIILPSCTLSSTTFTA